MFMALFSSDFAQWNPLQIERDWIHGHLLDCREVGQPSAEVWRAICSVHRFLFVSSPLFCKFLLFLLLDQCNGTDMCQNVQKWVGAQCKCSSRASETQQQSNREWDCKSSVRVQRQHCILREGAFLIPLSELPSGTELEGESVNDGQVDTQGWHSYREKGDMKEEMLVLICSFDTGSVPS